MANSNLNKGEGKNFGESNNTNASDMQHESREKYIKNIVEQINSKGESHALNTFLTNHFWIID